MKTKSLLLFFLLLVGISHAQTQFNNAGFELWSQKTSNGFKYNDPDSWYTLNSLGQFGFDLTTVKTTEAHSGTSAALLSSISSTFGDIPGLLTIMPILDPSGDPDLNLNYIPFTARPSQIQFWYKSYPETGDENALFCALTKWNTLTKTRDTIAVASWGKTSTVTEYTLAVVNFNYQSSLSPDSLTLLISSSLDGFNPTPGSELFIDDVQLNYTNGFNEILPEVNITLYPNPTVERVRITSDETMERIFVKDQLGRTHMDIFSNNTDDKINLRALPDGVYFFEVKFKNIETTKTIKVVKLN